MDDDRRRVLRALAGAVAGTAGLAGCVDAGGSAGDGGDGPERTDTPTATDPRGQTTHADARESPRRTPAETPTTADGPRDARVTAETTSGPATTDGDSDGRAAQRVVLERIDGQPSGTLAVYQRELRDLLREAATTDGVVRRVAATSVDNPQPVLPAFDAVELVGGAGAASGVYEVRAEARTRYEMVVAAEDVADYEGEVTALSSLPAERRAFLRAAIRGEYASVFPETERGAWVRHDVFGHAFEHEGTVYRFRERSATDAAFFSGDAWYRLELVPTDDPESEPVRLRLDGIDDAVRATLDPLVESGTSRRAPERVASDPGAVSEAVATLADRIDGLLIHVGALALRVE